MGILDKAKTAETSDPGPWSIAIYGYPGVGKSVFAAHASRPFVLMVDNDGERSYRNHPELRNVPYVNCRTYAAVVRAIRELKSSKTDLEQIDTIIVDTMSELQQRDRMDQVKAKGDPTDANWKFNEHIYTINNFHINVVVDELLELRKNLILVYHLKEEEVGTGDAKRTRIRPATSPELMHSTIAKISGCMVYERSGKDRRLRLVSNPTDSITKSRFKGKAEELSNLLNPSFEDLQQLMERK